MRYTGPPGMMLDLVQPSPDGVNVEYMHPYTDANLYTYAANSPMRWIDPSGMYCQVPQPCARGENRECLSRVGFAACRQAWDCGNVAFGLSDRTGLPGRHNGPRDALRHCILNCCMAATIGPGAAKTIGDLHEECGGNPGDEICMDLWNNAVGRALGTRITGRSKPQKCFNNCMGALATGLLASAPFGNCSPPGPPAAGAAGT